ncbi:hypothetical protein IWW55_006830, partial [Coemansia sp. RSA 2706]
ALWGPEPAPEAEAMRCARPLPYMLPGSDPSPSEPALLGVPLRDSGDGVYEALLALLAAEGVADGRSAGLAGSVAPALGCWAAFLFERRVVSPRRRLWPSEVNGRDFDF